MNFTWPDRRTREKLDYQVDWSSRLNGDKIISHSFVVNDATLTIADSDSGDTISVVWLIGGRAGVTSTVIAQVTTAGGRTHEIAIELKSV